MIVVRCVCAIIAVIMLVPCVRIMIHITNKFIHSMKILNDILKSTSDMMELNAELRTINNSGELK